MGGRVRCASCGTEQNVPADRSAVCVICGASLAEAAETGQAETPRERPEDRRSASEEAPHGLSRKVEDVFQLEEGDLASHAARLPGEAPKGTLREIEDLFAGEKRSGTILAFVPLWGILRISRSPDHSGGEKIFLSVLSLVLTVAIAFGLSRFRPGEVDRLAGLHGQIGAQIQVLSRIVEEFHEERGDYPREEDWAASAEQADLRFYDPWGRPYVYEQGLDSYRIGSWGRDGKPGGRDEDADIFIEFGGEPQAGAETSGVPPGSQHVLLDMEACPAIDIGSGARLELDGALHVNARCESPSAAIRLASNAKLEVERGAPRSGASPVDDPLRQVTAPAFDGKTFVTPEQHGGLPGRHGEPGAPLTQLVDQPTVLSPGVYWGGVRVVSGGQATLRPGEYVFAGGGLLVFGNGSLTGTDVLLYNTIDPLHPGGLGGFEQFLFDRDTTVRLGAPTSGAYRGIVLFQDRANRRPVELRGSLDLDGAIYAPSAELRLAGPEGRLRTRLVVGRLTTQSSLRIEAPTQSLPTRTSLRRGISPAIPGFV